MRLRLQLLAGGGVALALALLGWSAWANAQINQLEVEDPRTGAPGALIKLNGFQLHYQLDGDPLTDPTGAPILLLHGFTSSGHEFSRLTPLLAPARRLIRLDLLGFGHSERVLTATEAYGHPGQAALAVALLDALGVAQVDVIGASYGGGIAAQLALDHPERVRRIVWLDAQVYDAGGNAWVAALPFGLDRAVTWTVLGGGPGGAALSQSACAPASTTCFDAELAAARGRQLQIRGYTDALLAFSRSPRNARVPADLGLITQPSLILWGEADAIIPPEFGRRLAQAVPNAKLVWVANAGHVPHVEQPALVAREVLAFLGE